jgi:hypothetical protein
MAEIDYEGLVKKALMSDSTLEAIGEDYGITKQRVSQILQQGGLDRNELISKLKENSEKFRCVICGEVKAPRRVSSPYCSKACRRINAIYDFSAERNCKYCGKPFFPYRIWKYTQSNKGIYCCMEHYLKDKAHPSYVKKYKGEEE